MFLAKKTPATAAPVKPEPVAPFAPMTVDDQRIWGALSHTATLFGGAVAAGYAYWLLRHRGGHIRQHVAAALNFELSLLLYSIVFGGALVAVQYAGFAVLLIGAIGVWRVVGSVAHTGTAHRGRTLRPAWVFNVIR